MSLTEAQLDTALAEALSTNYEFSEWFLSRTRFRGESARCVFCRSDNPWSSVRFELRNASNGELEKLSKECETDVLVVYETPDGRRLAVHIENKLANGSFTPHQPELYRQRLHQWKGRAKLGKYIDATNVLVAPQSFFNKHRSDAEIFESFVSHEQVAAHLPMFGKFAAI